MLNQVDDFNDEAALHNLMKMSNKIIFNAFTDLSNKYTIKLDFTTILR